MTTLGRITFMLLITGCAGGSPVTPAQQPAWPELHPHALPAYGTLFVASAKTIEVYAPPYDRPKHIIPSEIRSPAQLVVAPNGTLFERDSYGSLVAFKPPYTSRPIKLGTKVLSIAADAQSRLVLGRGFDANTLALIPPPYTGKPVVFWHPFQAWGLFVDSHGNLFACGAIPGLNVRDAVEEFKEPYSGPPETIITNSLEYLGDFGPPNGAAEDPAGDLFVMIQGGTNSGGEILEYAPPYNGSPKAGTQTDWILSIQMGADQTLIELNCGQYCYPGQRNVLRLTPPYTGRGHRLPVYNPSGMALGRNLRLFVRNETSISIFAPPYKDPPSTTITKGVQGDGPIAVYAPP